MAHFILNKPHLLPSQINVLKIDAPILKNEMITGINRESNIVLYCVVIYAFIILKIRCHHFRSIDYE